MMPRQRELARRQVERVAVHRGEQMRVNHYFSQIGAERRLQATFREFGDLRQTVAAQAREWAARSQRAAREELTTQLLSQNVIVFREWMANQTPGFGISRVRLQVPRSISSSFKRLTSLAPR